jgi:hypothetical protein
LSGNTTDKSLCAILPFTQKIRPDARPHICRLTALTSIDISSSGFSGPLPASFNSTTSPKLASFTAFGNNLSGALPTSLPMSLTTLGLGYNKFNGSLPAYTSTDLAYIQVSLCRDTVVCAGVPGV